MAASMYYVLLLKIQHSVLFGLTLMGPGSNLLTGGPSASQAKHCLASSPSGSPGDGSTQVRTNEIFILLRYNCCGSCTCSVLHQMLHELDDWFPRTGTAASWR
jgi:hypothetical protein